MVYVRGMLNTDVFKYNTYTKANSGYWSCISRTVNQKLWTHYSVCFTIFAFLYASSYNKRLLVISKWLEDNDVRIRIPS